jgi:hypothetical protein
MADWLAYSGWIFTMISTVLGAREWFLGNARKSVLRSAIGQLATLQASIVEEHREGSVIKSDMGKRYLSTLAFHVVSIINHLQISLGERMVVEVFIPPPPSSPPTESKPEPPLPTPA